MYKDHIFQEFKGRAITLPQPFYTEGPVIDREGNLFVTNLKGGQILKIDKNGAATEWARTTCPNGQMINEKGDHLVCDSLEGAIKQFDKSGRLDKIAVRGLISGYRISCPNDLISDTNGGFFLPIRSGIAVLSDMWIAPAQQGSSPKNWTTLTDLRSTRSGANYILRKATKTEFWWPTCDCPEALRKFFAICRSILPGKKVATCRMAWLWIAFTIFGWHIMECPAYGF